MDAEIVSSIHYMHPQYYNTEFVGQLPDGSYLGIYEPDSSHPALRQFQKDRWTAMGNDEPMPDDPTPQLYKYVCGQPDKLEIADVERTEISRGAGVEYRLSALNTLWRAQLSRAASIGCPPPDPNTTPIPPENTVRVILFPQNR